MEVACLGKQRKKRARNKERTALEIGKTHILLAETQRWASLNMILDDFLQWKYVEMDELASFSGGEAQKWTSNAPRSWYCHFERLY
jgi:CelD/BcsL family acetyltransferase involved in cellulose biosynthesis